MSDISFNAASFSGPVVSLCRETIHSFISGNTHRVFREVPFGDETPCEGIEHEITDTVFNQLFAKTLHVHLFIAEKHASGIYEGLRI